MNNSFLRFAIIACACMALISCSEPEEEYADTGGAKPAGTAAPLQRQAVPTQPVVGNAQQVSAGSASDRPVSVKVDIVADNPLMPLKGHVDAQVVDDATRLVPGLLADGFLGDTMLENDLLRVVISKPGRQVQGGSAGGNIIDIVNRKMPMDHLNYLMTIPDVDATATQIQYLRADSPRVEQQTTASVTVYGVLGERLEDQPDTAPLRKKDGMDVVTTYSVPKNQHFVEIATEFRNNTSAPLSLAPVDVVDWGHAQVFVEGIGFAGSSAQANTNWVAGMLDDGSVGYVSGDGRRVSGVHSMHFSLIRGAGEEPITLLSPKQTVEGRGAVPTPTPTPMIPARFRGITPTRIPGTTEPVVQATPSGTRPGLETSFAPPIPQLRLNETNYSPSTILAPPTPAGKVTPSPQALVTPKGERKEPLGGASPDDNDKVARDPRSSRVVIAPGGSFRFTRYLVVSDRDLSRFGRLAYSEGHVTTGAIAGIVLEQGTYAPIAGAEVRVSGGPTWSPEIPANAYCKTITKADGTFSLHVPTGKYLVMPYAPGRLPVSQGSAVQVTSSTAPVLLPLTASARSTLRLGVSEAETPTSVPLPCKVTFLAKPGTFPMNWGMSGDITQGVRNVFYLPRGGAEIPVDPGNYQITISRGIEYEVVERDVAIQPGKAEELLVSLPKAIKSTPGMIATDLGIMTTASAISNVTPRDRVIMAVCEGVPVIVTGDLNTATELQPIIEQLGLSKRVKAFAGMRFMVGGTDFAANILMYPVDGPTAQKLLEFRKKAGAVPPDVFLADLRRQFPDLVIQIDDPVHPDWGYLNRFPFDDQKKVFAEGAVPPPDFDALQVLPGNRVALERLITSRYDALAIARTQLPTGSRALTPMGCSSSRLPYNEEVGYPRAYLQTPHDTLDRLLPQDLVTAIKGQHVMVTNGPFVKFWAYDPKSQQFNKFPGDVADYSTTGVLTSKLNVFAASWVGVGGYRVSSNGMPDKVAEIRPLTDVLRYPVHKLPDSDVQNTYLQGDSLTNVLVFSSKSLAPVVPDNPREFGGPVVPRGFTAPIFVDANGDGRLRVESAKPAQSDATTTPSTAGTMHTQQ